MAVIARAKDDNVIIAVPKRKTAHKSIQQEYKMQVGATESLAFLKSCLLASPAAIACEYNNKINFSI